MPILSLISKILGDPVEKAIQPYRKNVDLINPTVFIPIFSSANKKISRGVKITAIIVDAKVQKIDKERFAPQI